jgi:Na+/proline symporter
LSGHEHFFSEAGILGKLKAIDPGLATLTNPASLYFRNFIEVFFCNFIVGLAIVCQPHILGKSLLLKDSSQIKTYLAVAIIAGTVFVSVMFVGLYARLTLEQLTPIDRVVPTYIAQNFSSKTQVLISIGLLCAGISTLEGLLLALSAIFSSDIYLTLRPINPETRDKDLKKALLFGRLALIVAGIGCVFLSIWQLKNPTGGSVAIFAQYGVYLLFTATFLPSPAAFSCPPSVAVWSVPASLPPPYSIFSRLCCLNTARNCHTSLWPTTRQFLQPAASLPVGWLSEPVCCSSAKTRKLLQSNKP